MARLIGLVAVLVFAASVGAQVLPRCCAYLYDWSQNEGTPCSGGSTTVCETGSTLTNDPPAELLLSGYRWAQCCTVNVGAGGVFIAQPCELGPPYPTAHLVGTLPNGNCCWAYSPTGIINPICWNQGFLVTKCDTPCGGGGGDQ